jgi:hypothetical protein
MSEQTKTEVVTTPPGEQPRAMIEFGSGGGGAGGMPNVTAVAGGDVWGQIEPLKFIGLMGVAFCQSGLFGAQNVHQGHVLALACLVEKRNPLELARTYHMIEGKLSMRADAMQAEFERRGGEIQWVDFGDTGERATAKFTYKKHKNLEISFTIQEAQRARLVKPDSNWAKSPGPMLRARLISKAVRILAPGIVAGTYTPEELNGGLPEEAEPDRVTVAAECVPVEPVAAAAPVAAAGYTAAPAAFVPTSRPTPAVLPIATHVAVAPVAAGPAPIAPAPAAADLGNLDSVEPSLAPPMISDEQYREIGNLAKNVLKIPASEFVKILAKRKHWQTGAPVAKARELTADQAESLLANLRAAQRKQELNAWVAGAPAERVAVAATPAEIAIGKNSF